MLHAGLYHPCSGCALFNVVARAIPTYPKHLDLEYCTLGPGARKTLNYLRLVPVSMSRRFLLGAADAIAEQFLFWILDPPDQHGMRFPLSALNPLISKVAPRRARAEAT